MVLANSIKKIRRFIRNSSIGSMFLDSLPCLGRLPGDERRLLPRCLYLLLREMQQNQDFLNECEMVYSFFRGGDVIDIGSYLGTYSLILAGKYPAETLFLSLEPNKTAFKRLAINLSAMGNIFPHVDFVPLPFAAGNGESCRFEFPMGDGYHARVVSDPLATGKNTITIDQLVGIFNIRPGFVKIDVEGAEFYVLQGMKDCLKDHKPDLMIEFHPSFQPDGIKWSNIVEILEKNLYEPCSDRIVSTASVRQLWRCAQ